MDSNKGEFQYEIYVSHNRKKLSELESLESWRDRIIEKGALIAFAEGEVLVLVQNIRMAIEIMGDFEDNVDRKGRPFKIWSLGRPNMFAYIRGSRKKPM